MSTALGTADDTMADTSHPSTGWLDLEGSPIKPWCAAVLVAPDVAVTATACATTNAAPLRFGTGVPSEGGLRVARVVPLGDERVVALLLEQAALDAEPARPMMGAGDGEAVEGVAMGFTPRGETSQRWTWDGALRVGDDGVHVDLPALADADFAQAPLTGTPNCHGDNGAGVYTLDGALAGIVVGAHHIEAAWCVDSLVIAASLDGGADLLAEARALSADL